MNVKAAEADRGLAHRIRRGSIDAIIAISSDPKGVNAAAVAAAVEVGVPVVGTGGTSVSVLASAGCRVLGASGGSVGTSPETKAVIFSAALAAHFGHRYSYNPGGRADPPFHAIVAGVLPIMLLAGVAGVASPVAHKLLGTQLLPSQAAVVAAATAAHSTVAFGTMAAIDVVAGAAVGAAAATKGSILASVLAGATTAKALPRLLGWIARYGAPTTPATLFATAGACCVGIVTLMLTADACLGATNAARGALAAALTPSPIVPGIGVDWLSRGALTGAVLALFTTHGSWVGLYHRVVLPLIAIEMEAAPANFAFFGALDFCCLCLAGAGVCAAAWVSSSYSEADARLGKFGAVQNLLVGDFVEACGPFVERSPTLAGIMYAAATAAGAILGHSACRSSAYMPAPMAIAVGGCDDGARGPLILASAVAFGVPFLGGLVLATGGGGGARASSG